ncbi:DoxX family protein [Methylobacterium tarhaniae]|uniref:DoxX family protein n=1 Tax=Methylobacterium tarhaniae TaxID=1187852 RepID=UPI003D01AD12
MSQTLALPASPSRGRNVTAWILSVVLALAYLAAGGAKLAGVPMMVQTFDQIGVGQWFRIVTGLVEVAGAVALLVPGYAFFGAVWLAATMAGAVLAHLLVLPTPAAPAVLLLILDVALAWLRRDQSARLAARLR